MRLRAAAWALALLTLFLAMPPAVHAGGPEFPAGGTRSLGRGGAGFLRADDPSIMTRNPAALADLWDDQALFGAHLLLVDACMQPTGGYSWGVTDQDVSNFGQGPVYLQAPENSKDLQGRPLKGYLNEPFPKVCYQGPAPFLPQIALSMKLSDKLGVGLGFFPPDTAATNQWGNRDGTVDTKNGLRPNPLRYYDSHLNVSFFSLLSAVGWRPADWLSVGLGFQWSMVIFSASTWTNAITSRAPSNDIRADIFGRDLFVPGIIASANLRPIDALDIGLGFKWSDRVVSSAKLDIISGVWGNNKVFEYMESDGSISKVGSSVRSVSPNQPGTVNSPPIWVPQATFSLRFADRLKPRPKGDAAHEAAGGVVEDHMSNERWDIEADAVYYFNSVYDAIKFTNTGATLDVVSIDAMGNRGSIPASVGKCQVAPDPVTKMCPNPSRLTTTPYHGKDQISVRVGGDYNLFPGLFAVRGGVSYETDGQDPQYFNVRNYMLSRTGIHAGVTLRVAEKTDISFAWAHFFQRDVTLQVNDTHTASPYPRDLKNPTYHFKPGKGVADVEGNGADAKNGFDGIAGVELPNGDLTRTEIGPDFINAGSYYYHLDVASMTFTQHF
jgi:long-subunit fatty acid transport protein